jgi:hypothetical protein
MLCAWIYKYSGRIDESWTDIGIFINTEMMKQVANALFRMSFSETGQDAKWLSESFKNEISPT